MKNLISLLTVVFTVFGIYGTSSVDAQNLFFERVFDETLAQASYIIGDKQTGDAIVIDPKRDIDTYLAIAKQNKLNIKQITETHIHADFLTGSRELAHVTGAQLLLSDEGGQDWQYQFAHTSLRDGSIIHVGSIMLKVMHTPGHTPESISFLLMDGLKPVKAFTGDFIFVGDVGRPDLLEKAAGMVGTQEKGARDLFVSLNEFMKLPDNLEIWPGHGAGSFCGKSLSHIPQSTLGEEKKSNPALKYLNNQEAFVKYILEGQPAPPRYFAMMKHLNKVDRPLLIEVPKHAVLSKEDFLRAQQNKLTIIDTRTLNDFAIGLNDGVLQINGGKFFSTWLGSVLDYNQQMVLIAPEQNREDLTRKLMRIGMDNIYGFVSPADVPAPAQSDLISMQEFKQYLNDKNVVVLDVRNEGEYKSGHIAGVANLAFPRILELEGKHAKNKPIVVHCQSGVRASIAYSMLKKQGFTNVKNYIGGMNEWVDANNEVVQ